MRSRLLASALLLALLGGPGTAAAKVFLSRAEALETAFPEADEIERRSLVLDDAQARAVEESARSPLESRIVTVYTGKKGNRVLGYAFIDVHTVRTLPEAFLVVLDPEGHLQMLRVLAFHEPQEYLPPERWLEQFEGRALDDRLRLGGEIHGIAGSTLSARAVTGTVRRSLALFEMFVRPARAGPTGSSLAESKRETGAGGDGETGLVSSGR